MATPVITPVENQKTGKALALIHRRNGGREAHQIVELARRYTQAAIRKMADLMNGKAGRIKTLDKNGNVVEIDIEVPAAVQLKAAETLIERGFGKAPLAVLLKNDPMLPGEGQQTMTVMEKILALSEAQDKKEDTTDLEASEVTEIVVSPPHSSEEPVTAADMI